VAWRGEERRFAGSLVVSSARRVSRARRAATMMDENHVANVGEALRMRAEAVATLEKYVHPIPIPSPPASQAVRWRGTTGER